MECAASKKMQELGLLGRFPLKGNIELRLSFPAYFVGVKTWIGFIAYR
jgi:hypothetical protein